jgi:hypothetical protein
MNVWTTKFVALPKSSSCNSSGSSPLPYLANKKIAYVLKTAFGVTLVTEHDPYVYCMQLRSTVYSHHLLWHNVASAVKRVSVKTQKYSLIWLGGWYQDFCGAIEMLLQWDEHGSEPWITLQVLYRSSDTVSYQCLYLSLHWHISTKIHVLILPLKSLVHLSLYTYNASFSSCFV